MALSLGIVFGLIAMIGFGISNAISKVPAKALGSRKTVFFRNAITSLILFIALFFIIFFKVLDFVFIVASYFIVSTLIIYFPYYT